MQTNTEKQLREWIDSTKATEMIPFSSFPELDLYMDQVITLMHRQLEPLSVDTDRPLTPSMINNYVKDGVMPRPEQKKYTRDHLTVLSIICMLKSEFALPEIRELVGALSKALSTEELYTAFCDSQLTHLRAAADRLDNFESLSETDRDLAAMDLALEANAKRLAAARLLSSLTPPPAEEPKKEKKKKKKEMTDPA